MLFSPVYPIDSLRSKTLLNANNCTLREEHPLYVIHNVHVYLSSLDDDLPSSPFRLFLSTFLGGGIFVRTGGYFIGSSCSLSHRTSQTTRQSLPPKEHKSKQIRRTDGGVRTWAIRVHVILDMFKDLFLPFNPLLFQRIELLLEFRRHPLWPLVPDRNRGSVSDLFELLVVWGDEEHYPVSTCDNSRRGKRQAYIPS
jgi:hypothetical protein